MYTYYIMPYKSYSHSIIVILKQNDSILSTGSTRIDKALLEAEKKFFCATCGAKKAKVLFMMTDGSNDAGTMSVSHAAQGLKVGQCVSQSV